MRTISHQKLIGFLALLLITTAIFSRMGAKGSVRSTNDSGGITTAEEWTLLVTGDVMLGRTVNTQTVRKYKDFNWPFAKTADLLQSADITFINLESPLVSNCPFTDSGMIFCGDIRHAGGLKNAGVDIASLANNHALNYGAASLLQTADALRAVGITPIGVQNPTDYEFNDIKIAFLGFDDVECYPQHIECAETENVTADIQSATLNADLVIVMFSWGVEYTHDPSTRQKELARLAIDSGADLVLGNHPHWVQPTEEYAGKLIVYSHGNFIFDQMWSEETRTGVVGIYRFKRSELTGYELVPVYISDYGQVDILEDEHAQKVIDLMKKQ